MRLLLITSVFPRCPSDDQVPWLRESCQRLQAAGVTVEVLAPSCRGMTSHELDGVRVHRFRYAPAAWETLTGEEGALSKVRRNPWLVLLAGMYLWSGFWALVGRLLKKHYDVVEVHWPFPLALMSLPAVWAGLPLIYHYHSAERKLASQNWLYGFLFGWSLGWARAHVANSSYTAGLIKKLKPALTIEVIGYGSPVKFLEGEKNKMRRRKILFVGRLIERKGLTYLIDAMKRLPEDYTLTVVGEGDLTEVLKAQAGQLGKTVAENLRGEISESNLGKAEGQGRVTFTGRISAEEIKAIYATHDIFVLPAIVDSRGDTEGLGVVLIEAIAVGLPIVASNVGGIPDVVSDGETGLLVEPKNPEALAQAIQKIGANEVLAQKLIVGARQHAREFFSWEMITRRTLEVYERVVADKKKNKIYSGNKKVK